MKLSTLPSLIALVLATGLAACTKPNPAVCCLDAADCDEVGIPEVRGCSQGLACVEHQCTVPSCAEAGCGAAAPVCNVTTDVCELCTDSAECARFGDTPVCGDAGSCVQCLATSDCSDRAATPVCETGSKTCVECLGPSDCSGIKNICDSNTCRAPRSDAECPSGALSAEGFCVPEAEVIYLSPTGTNTGSCNRVVPCLTLIFAFSVTTAARNHIVFAPGLYQQAAQETYSSSNTTAPSLTLHGHGAEIRAANGDSVAFQFNIPVTIRDLKVTSTTSSTQNTVAIVAGPSVLENVTASGSPTGAAFLISAGVVARNLTLATGASGIVLNSGAALTLDGAVFHHLGTGLFANAGTSVQLTNILTYETSYRAMTFLSGASGTVSSSTFVTSGAGSDSPRGISCPTTILLRSSIVWSPGATESVSGCNMTNVIAGPVLISGAANGDPMFVDAAQHNYHLAPGSPARDAVDSGPAFDIDGDARPQGARFDIGADEAMP